MLDQPSLAPSLAPWAAHPSESRGRVWEEPSHAYRDEFQRDRDRIIHSSAFRRLVYKTQVFVNHEGDLYRTRATHSLEVSQIGRTVARALGLNEHLTEAICLAHDLGHTPFGHAGQDTLNACMRDYGGFEHNLQSLRVVDELEEKYAEFPGLNLTFETREGILKHCSARNAVALGDIGKRFLERTQPGLEAQLADLVDAIAYNNHDVDDGLRSGLIELDDIRNVHLFRDQFDAVSAAYPGIEERRLIHETVRRMINVVVTDVIDQTRRNLEDAQPDSIDAARAAGRRLVGFSEDIAEQHVELKQFLRRGLYQHYRVLRATRKAQRVLKDLFEAFFADVQLLPPVYADNARDFEAREGLAGRARAIADYLAGMTDRFAIAESRRVFEPGEPG